MTSDFGVPIARVVVAHVLVLLLLATPETAEAHGGDTNVMHVCVTRSGVPRFVRPAGKCRIGETAVHWALSGPAEGPQGPAGPAGPQGPPGPQGAVGPASGLALVDNAGQVIGQVIALSGNHPNYSMTSVTVVSTLAEGSVLLDATSDGFTRAFGIPQVGFESLDCSGTPYISADWAGGRTENGSVWVFTSGLFLRAIFAGSDRTLYVGDTTATPRERLMRSTHRGDNACFLNSFAITFSIPVRPLVNLGNLFVPPFRLR